MGYRPHGGLKTCNQWYSMDKSIPWAYGVGALRVWSERFAALGCKHIPIVCDGGVKATDLIEHVTAVLQQVALSYSLFDRIVSDPPNTLVDEGGTFAKEEGVNGVLGIGGGSLDAAKAIAILLTNPDPISRYYIARQCA